MSIQRQTELDNGKLCGYVDYGTDLESPELPIANNALTFMVSAVNGNLKIPIAYFLIDRLNAIERTNLIKIALECLYETGIKVVALTFDGLLCNFKVGNELGARLEAVNLKLTFPHPITGEDVCIFLDPCHCLKLVRNTLGSKGSMFDANNQIIDWSYVVELEKFQQDEGLLAATKIRNRHIQWYNEKMKVKLAAQDIK
ncbi:DNA transposase THAP9 [Araneus ventricosus]|uniref:DNA transposase THAP9 n=1 Tax=Araneus ventricosus TaxID=182803 RepID=A0A4Y2VBP8_ARAVE|nr:DNA transposase THAP9 [Araneus ventricosus]